MLRAAKTAFLLLLFSLPFMRPYVEIGGLRATAADALYLIAAAALAASIATGRARLRWDRLYWLLLAYFAAMLISAVAAEDPRRAWFKLATQLYLLSLPVLAFTLLRTRDDLKAALRTWLAAATIVSLLGAATVVLFYLGQEQPFGGYAVLPEFGSLPPGPYVRIRSTFDTPAMLCNYLAVSLLILLASRRCGWVRPFWFWLILSSLLVTAVFTLTPGLGGIFLALGFWGFLLLRKGMGVLALSIGVAAAAAFVLSAAVTPFLHSSAPFLIEIPGTDRLVAPSVRMMVWIDSFQTFAQQPIVGAGIGSDPARVGFVDPSGALHYPMTDAHNVILSIAAQCGIVGLAALGLLIAHVARRTASIASVDTGILPLALGAAWLIGFVYQGLTGSYEDARHLWVLLGLFLVALRLSPGPVAKRRADKAFEV